MQSSAGHVLLAPDKFKGSLTGAQVSERLAAGLRRAVPGICVRSVPVADGGDGTVDAAVEAGFRRVLTLATGPTGELIEVCFAIRDRTAVIEVAEASGLRRLPGGELAPLTASSYGTGLLIRAALDARCTRIILGLGGSACTDGGAGLVQALGARLLDEDGHDLEPGGGALPGLRDLDLSPLAALLAGVEIVVASDVDNPLLGPNGAAAIYAPQKGADAGDVALLDAALAYWSAKVEMAGGLVAADLPGAGAAGGIGFAAMAILGAELRSGIDLMLELAEFDARADGALLIVTGEGSLDAQSLRGKAPAGVARAAARLGVPVIAVAGICELSAADLEAVGIRAAYALTDIEPDTARCMENAGALVERLGESIGLELLAVAR
jgi:glycerate 2-kinase